MKTNGRKTESDEVESFLAHTRTWVTVEAQRDDALAEVARLRDERDALAATIKAMRYALLLGCIS